MKKKLNTLMKWTLAARLSDLVVYLVPVSSLEIQTMEAGDTPFTRVCLSYDEKDYLLVRWLMAKCDAPLEFEDQETGMQP